MFYKNFDVLIFYLFNSVDKYKTNSLNRKQFD